MENRLDREKRERRKAYARAKGFAAKRREATKEWLRQVQPKLARIASRHKLKMTKHPGRFLMTDDGTDVLMIWWTGRAAVKWVVPEEPTLAREIAEVLDEHPRG